MIVQKTPLYAEHEAAGGKMVDFHGWLLPIHYGSQIDEHNKVREDAGVFDVSHMNIVDLRGPESKAYLEFLLANDVNKLKADGKALYTAMLNEKGGIIDDLIVYKLGDHFYRLILNAATKEKDMAWLAKQANHFDVELIDREGLVNLAVQGPKAREKAAGILPEALREAALALKPFSCVCGGDWQVARTGYTGEDGFEILLPEAEAPAFWRSLLKQGVHPCGLGARDTLRLEAGLNLYGSDMDEQVTPLESNIAWTIAWEPMERDFIGRKALEQQRDIQHAVLIGLVLTDRGVLRSEQPVFQAGEMIGTIVSGTFSPTLKQSIAFARVIPKHGDACEVEIRGKRLAAQMVRMPFVRHGQAVFKPLTEEATL